ncbi:MAG: class I mannose-6-phosphate isomerase [Bacteroidales bacterium]|nr:class I mannose-6-phosphate isomerase [Bacteroidales bacterium]
MVAEGPLKGKTLPELIDAFGVDLLGRKGSAASDGRAPEAKKCVDASGTLPPASSASLTPRGAEQGDYAPRNVTAAGFPLLFKFIDAGDDLSVQVHPDDEMARRRGFPFGKTEMWYVVDAEPGARLFSGFSVPTKAEEFRSLALDGGIMERLGSYEVHPGDVFFLPAGRVHAIGRGCFVAEIQQSSDCTYRIYDYNRPGLDGRPRALHIDDALEATDFSVVENAKSHPDVPLNTLTPIVSCPYFNVSVLHAASVLTPCGAEQGDYAPQNVNTASSRAQTAEDRGWAASTPYSAERPLSSGGRADAAKAWLTVPCKAGESFTVLMCTEGCAEIETGIPADGPTKGHRTELRRGETLMIPACATSLKVLPSPEANLLVVSL